MSLIKYTIQKEKQRIDYMINEYRKKLDELPRGSVAVRKIGRNVSRKQCNG